MRSLRLLLADDDPYIRRVAEISLRRDGFAVSVAADGLEALRALTEQEFDLVVLDGIMPGLDGLEACRRIRMDSRTSHLPVVILSARSQQTDETAAAAVGATGYILKPFNALTLGAQVRKVCGELPVPS